MSTTYKDDPEERKGAGALVVAWLLLFAFAAGVVGWLYITGNQNGVVAGIPSVTAPIPPIAAAMAEAEPAREAAAVAEPGPEEPAYADSGAPPSAEPPPQSIEEAIAAADAADAEAPAPVPPQTEAQEPEPEAEAAPPEPEPEVETVAKAEAPPAAEPAPAPEQAAPPEPAPVEAKPAEAKPAEAKPVEAKPAEAKPAETMTAETEAAAKPIETEPVARPATPVAKPQPQPAPAPEAAPVEAPEPPAVETNLAALPEPKLVPAPDPALVERGREGPLPVIGADGRQPWQVYARPFDDSDKRPRIAVVITGLGLSGAATETAIQQLPGAVTLAFSPYAKNLEQWMNLARTAAHEVLLDLPMEPIDYPHHDPGPYTLLTSIDPKQNLFKMQWLLSRGSGYVGVTNEMGSRFTTSGSDLGPIIKTIKSRGLLFLDSRASEQSVAAKLAKEADMPWALNNRFIDAEASRPAIDARLAEVEEIAKKTGFAVAMGSAYPVTMERVAAWIPEAEKRGFAIAPVSAMANKQPLN